MIELQIRYSTNTCADCVTSEYGALGSDDPCNTSHLVMAPHTEPKTTATA